MKTNKLLASGAAIGLLGIVLGTFNINAADQDQGTQTGRRHRTNNLSSTFTQASGAIGQIERANKLIGRDVLGSDNQKLGKIDNIVVDLESGRVLYGVIGSGGVAGVGEKKRAVAPGVFQETTDNTARLSIDKAKLEGAPEFTKDIDKDTELGKAQFVNQVYQYFGQSAWWQGGAGSSASEGEFHNVHKASDVIGMKVRNVSNEDMGKIDNLMINLPQGRIVYAILDPDRSLNLGKDLYALPPNAFSLNTDRKTLTSDISKEKLAGAPHFAANNWAQLADSSFASQVYQYYGKQAYFQTGSSSLEPTGREPNKTSNK